MRWGVDVDIARFLPAIRPHSSRIDADYAEHTNFERTDKAAFFNMKLSGFYIETKNLQFHMISDLPDHKTPAKRPPHQTVPL
jgi:hypothetical protein